MNDPIPVAGWTDQGLQLEGGKIIPLPEFRALPRQSAALELSLKRGVEADKYGRIYGLVEIWHWCGNDPVRRHTAKVDLSDMLSYLQEGERVTPLPSDMIDDLPKEHRFSDGKWNVSDYSYFRGWCKELAQIRDRAKTRR